MQFLNHALSMSYNSKPMLNPILVIRMVRTTILHGVCNVSTFAFGAYAGLLVSDHIQDIEGGHQYGKIFHVLFYMLFISSITM